MKRLLWIGDAGCQSGFAKATHFTLDVLRHTWKVSVLGVNYRGDPNSYTSLYPMYPAGVKGDPFGVNRLEEIITRESPDVIVIQNDPWNIPRYMKRFGDQWPVIAALAVDGKNCRGRALNGLTLAIFWTQFALNEARAGGYAGPAAVVPLGVDLALFKPQEKRLARELLGLPPKLRDVFIVGNVNRNQLRKRLDLTILYFSEWVKSRNIDDAYLFLHVAPTGDVGYDCHQLAAYYGTANRLILVEPEVYNGVAEEKMPRVYSCFDVQVTTSQGEGWGLPTMEGMACGVPQIVPKWAALEEWCGEAAYQVNCPTTTVTPDNINSIGGIPDKAEFIEALDRMYQRKDVQAAYVKKGFELVNRPEYRWRHIGEQFRDVIDDALDLAIQVKAKKTDLVNA